MVRIVRILVIGLIALFLSPLLAGCSDDRTPEQKKADAAAEAVADAEKRQQKVLGIVLDSGGWNEAERTFAQNGTAYAIVGTDSLTCAAKFTVIPGEGEGVEELESASFTFVAVVANMDGDNAIPLSDLPGAFSGQAAGLTKDEFNKLVKDHRGSNPELAKICKDD
jgi:hypothetical protein